MSSFRDQLGEDWLRYQHHLDGASASTNNTNQPSAHPQPLPNGLNTTTRASTGPGHLVPEVLPPLLLSPEPKLETSNVEADLETESTLQWTAHSPQHTESTLECSVVDGPASGSPQPSPESQRSARGGSVDTKDEEEEEDLGGRVTKK